jgi:hypothetical protein
VHDITNLEARGIPSVFVASSVFVDAAEAQARALGFPNAARVFVPHPIQDRSDQEMQALAETVVDDVLRALIAAA